MRRLRSKEEVRARVRAEAEARRAEEEAARRARARGDDPEVATKKGRKSVPASEEAA